jgi:predicted extracellular nuclease
MTSRRLCRLCIVLFLLILVFGWHTDQALARVEAITPICKIQGQGFTSPLDGKTVTTRGVVYGDQDDASRRGFYIQQENCDGKAATSDGLFVYLSVGENVVRPGDLVEVNGQVTEYFGMTELNAAPVNVLVLSSGNSLPSAVSLNPPFENEAARIYFESLEGMYVKLDRAITVGPTDGSSLSWVVDAGLGIGRVFRDDPRGTGEIVCIGDEGTHFIDPQVKVGDPIQNIRGALDYEVGNYCVQLLSQAQVIQTRSLEAAWNHVPFITSSIVGLSKEPFTVRLATFNLSNLFDTIDDPSLDDTVLSAAEYQRRLQKRALAIQNALDAPELLAIQEVENEAVLQALVGRPELTTAYSYLWEDSPDERGLDIAIMYRPDRVQILGYRTHQDCTILVDGLGPDGNGDVYNPVNAISCDTDGDGLLDGNRLFSRPPLVIQVWMPGEAVPGSGIELWVIVNHLKSKIEDSATVEYTLPRRKEQALFLVELANEIRANDPGASLVILGDLNDYPESEPLMHLKQARFLDSSTALPSRERYTFNYQGVSQVLDYVLHDLRGPLACVKVTPVHINADYPVIFSEVNESIYRSSDHDLMLVSLQWFDYQFFLPWTVR